MGDKESLAKAKSELEDLYLGIPDESVNLTFQDFAQVKQSVEEASPEKKPIPGSRLNKLPSLDFNTSLQGTRRILHHDHHHNVEAVHNASPRCRSSYTTSAKKAESRQAAVEETSMAFDSASAAVSFASGFQEDNKTPQRRRPGIPHSNICTTCNTCVYVFRHRCLVCGRVYCRNCVCVGMGEMAEGRKCISCLGRRFSQRYIKRAGMVGCCTMYMYPSKVKQAELKWAEKGARRSGEQAYRRSAMMSPRARSPMRTTLASPLSSVGDNTPSFVSSSTYSPYLPSHHHFPL